MDELMTEASDLILSTHRNNTVTSKKTFRRDAAAEEDPLLDSYVSSVSLLKLSILNSINNRCIEVEVAEGKTSREKRSKKYKDPTVSPRIEIEALRSKTPDAEEPPGSHALVEDASVYPSEDTSSRLDSSHSEFSRLLGRGGSELSHRGDGLRVESPKEIQDQEAGNKRTVENGLNLARRRSSAIFENCSTYHLTCSEVPLKSSGDADSSASEPSPEKGVDCNIDNAAPSASGKGTEADKPSVSKSEDAEAEDPSVVSLGDSFFASVTDGVELSHRRRAFSGKDIKSMILPNAAESGATDPSCDKASCEHSKERKSSKRGRKRQKKKREKAGLQVYTCPKCRISYSLSQNTPTSTVRCLHCDFWTSVEPVFVKQEKMAWNICRIC